MGATTLYQRMQVSKCSHYELEDCDSNTILLSHACPSEDHSVGWFLKSGGAGAAVPRGQKRANDKPDG